MFSDDIKDELDVARKMVLAENFPQAELHLRRYLKSGGKDPEALNLLKVAALRYGVSDAFRLSEVSEQTSPVVAPKYLLIKAWGFGFWSEVKHLISQLLLARLTRRTPIVLWGKNCLFRNETDVNAFERFFQEINALRIDDVDSTATIYPAKWSSGNLYQEDNNTWDGKDSRVAAQYLFDRSETLLVSDFFSPLSSIIPWIGPSSRYYGLPEEVLYAELLRTALQPAGDIQSMATDFYAKNMHGRPWVAVHVPGSFKIRKTPDLAEGNLNYVSFVDRILELNPGIGIFLLTDYLQVIEEFKQRYGTRVLSIPACRFHSNARECMDGQDAVAVGTQMLLDALLAVKCDYFVGNQASDISVAIARMRDWPRGFLFLLGRKDDLGDELFLHRRERNQQDTVVWPLVHNEAAANFTETYGEWCLLRKREPNLQGHTDSHLRRNHRGGELIETYCKWHLGDNLTHLHFLRSLAKRYPEIQFRHALNPAYIDQCNEVITDIENIALASITEAKWQNSFDAWKGADNFFFSHPNRFEFGRLFVDLFKHLAKKMGLDSPITEAEQLLFDYPSIVQERGLLPFDVLLINSMPLSEQFKGFSEEGFLHIANKLRESGQSVVTTRKLPGFPCTMDIGLTVTGIANLSLKCRYLIAVCTGSMWPSINIFNNDLHRCKLILNDHETIDFGKNVVMCREMGDLRSELTSLMGIGF